LYRNQILGAFAAPKGLDTLDKGTTIRIVLLMALFVLGVAGAVRADVVFVGPADIDETGFSHVDSITTIQTTDHKQDQTDSDMNQDGNNGDDEKGPSDKDSDKDTDNDGDGGHDDDPPRSFTPEPASLLLLGTGICLFGGLLRRRLIST
jgi:hypothetical protein